MSNKKYKNNQKGEFFMDKRKFFKVFTPWILIILIITRCSNNADKISNNLLQEEKTIVQTTQETEKFEQVFDIKSEIETEEKDIPSVEENDKYIDEITFNGKYKLIEVDGGDLNGIREPMVVVDVGFGDREYWAYTNEYGQLVRVVAKQIILQDDKTEPVTADGRYYADCANVPGTERPDLDKGHVIADSLGGVSNAYNITPQDNVLNRYGDQAYMEKVIRSAGGCTDFEAIITYPDTKTQIPSHYKYTYKINGEVIVDEFDNVNPDLVNKQILQTTSTVKETTDTVKETTNKEEVHDISSIDTNNDGKVTIKEAKAAGFKMPITKDHWLYQYMDDRDGDGMVGE